MPTIAIISQKGGAGKTTLALHLAAAAEDSGHTALVIDLDPQATASQWAAWRQDAPPVVIDSAPPRLAAKIEQATGQGAAFIVIDTPPHADSAASAAVEAADLVLIPCRPSAFDLAAIKTTASLVKMRGKPAFVIFTAGSPTMPRSSYRIMGWTPAPTISPIVPPSAMRRPRARRRWRSSRTARRPTRCASFTSGHASM
jgi:chromosome partitioning protein